MVQNYEKDLRYSHFFLVSYIIVDLFGDAQFKDTVNYL